MKGWPKIAALLVFVAFTLTGQAQAKKPKSAKPAKQQQDKGSTGPREKTIKMEMKSNRQMRFEKREQRRKERAERKAIKAYHKRLQTKKTRKRMKQSRKAATRYNNNEREPFYVRWFRKKR